MTYHNQPTPTRPAYDPGESYGIVGIVMLVIGLPFIGIFLSVAGYKKSKKAGYHNTLAQVGIWLNAVFIVILGLVIAGGVALLAWGFKEGDKQLDQARAAASAAQDIQAFAKGYGAVNGGQYPDYTTLLEKYTQGNATLPDGTTLVQTKNPAPGQVGYQECYASNGTISGLKLYFADSNSDNTEISNDSFYNNTSTIVGVCSEYGR